MKKKISDKDKQDWEQFINSTEKLDNKDKSETKELSGYIEKSIDLHGYTLDEANQKISQFIENCYLQGVSKINIITGKGLRSQNLNDPYKSKDLSILKNSVPEFITSSTKTITLLCKCFKSISEVISFKTSSVKSIGKPYVSYNLKATLPEKILLSLFLSFSS